MNKLSLILTSILMLSLVVIFAPNVLAFNRGKMLRNIAIWLTIVVVLALLYKNFGPVLPGADKNAAMMPTSLIHDRSTGDQGFTPPKE